MPEISRFLGIVVAMYYSDHAPPHIHARYGEHEVRVHIATGAILSGSLPPRARRMVLEWRALHETALLDDWKRAQDRQPLIKIPPLE